MRRGELFPKVKDFVLGKRYDLSVAFLSTKEMRKVAKKYKHKYVASNVLAFPLSKHSGEILICPATARAQCKKYGMSERVFIAYLFIHGLLHLRGLRHGVTMEREERRVMQKFGLRANESH